MKNTIVTLVIGAAVSIAVWVLVMSKVVPIDSVFALFPIQIAIFTACAFFFSWTTVEIPRVGLKIAVALAGVALVLTCSWIVSLYEAAFLPCAASSAILLSLALGLLYGLTAHARRRRRMEALLGQRIAKKDFERVVEEDMLNNFRGTRVEASVLVCEVHNQRELLAAMSPEDHSAMVNLYLQTTSDYLVSVGAYLDECTGEELRVVFGAPVPALDHATRACRAALELLKRVDELNRECDARWQQRLDVRVGIDSGDLVAAAYGGRRLAGFSVTGAAAGFARRLCTACGTYGSRVLAGPDTVAQTGGEAFEVRSVEVLAVETGRNRRVEIFEVLAPKGGLSEERERSREHFWRGVLFYREGSFKKALEEFQQARITGLPDATVEFYLHRVDRAMQGGNVERNPFSKEV